MTSAANTGALTRLLEQATQSWACACIGPPANDGDPRCHCQRLIADADARLIALAPDAIQLLTDMAATLNERSLIDYDPEVGVWRTAAIPEDDVDALLARFAALEERAVQ